MDKRNLIDAYAEAVIRKAKETGVWEVRCREDGKSALTMQYTRPLLREDLITPDKRLGYYILFDDNNLNPVYVGYGRVADRIYRFFKELKGLSREDESHSAARKYRNTYGHEAVKESKWQVAIVWQDDLTEAPEEILSMVDERVAEILGARFNRRTIGNSLPI